jgi:hypothetical protein
MSGLSFWKRSRMSLMTSPSTPSEYHMMRTSPAKAALELISGGRQRRQCRSFVFHNVSSLDGCGSGAPCLFPCVAGGPSKISASGQPFRVALHRPGRRVDRRGPRPRHDRPRAKITPPYSGSSISSRPSALERTRQTAEASSRTPPASHSARHRRAVRSRCPLWPASLTSLPAVGPVSTSASGPLALINAMPSSPRAPPRLRPEATPHRTCRAREPGVGEIGLLGGAVEHHRPPARDIGGAAAACPNRPSRTAGRSPNAWSSPGWLIQICASGFAPSRRWMHRLLVAPLVPAVSGGRAHRIVARLVVIELRDAVLPLREHPFPVLRRPGTDAISVSSAGTCSPWSRRHSASCGSAWKRMP